MPSKRTSRQKKSNDALAMLKADHDKVKKMFKEFERMTEDEPGEEAQQLAAQICNELKVHTMLEEEIFYPEARAALEDDEDLIDEAEVEHASAKDLIEQIEGMGGSDDKFVATVTVLGEYVNHHVKEEQDEMFPKVKKAKQLDLAEMAERMMARKQELMQEMGMAGEGEEGEGGEAEEGQPRRRGGSRSSHASR
jgi:hemerythrin-like domain-containing protein